MNCQIDLLLARTQAAGFLISLAGFLGLIYILLLGHVEFTQSAEKLAYVGLGAFGGFITSQITYFYSRPRPHTAIDPTPDPTQPVGPAATEKKP